jgi:hypothetical protein
MIASGMGTEWEVADGGVWRVAFAFDPERKAILMVAGDKGGVGKRQFYRDLIRVADGRFGKHLTALRQKKGTN